MMDTGILQEHQAPEKDQSDGADGYTPSPEDKKTLKLVNGLFEKAKAHRQGYDKEWADFYKMFRGKQWKESRPSYRHAEVINMVFQNIQSVVPILTDARPRFEFLPEEPGDREVAEILNQVAESDWQKGNWLLKLTEIIYDAHFYGTGLGSMEFDPDGKSGVGKIQFRSSDPFYCFPDPNATDVNEKARFFIYAEPVDISVLKREYPDKAKFIKGDLLDILKQDKTDLDQVRFKSPVDNKTVLEGSSPYELDSKDQALKITCYVLSDEFDEEEVAAKGDDGAPLIDPLSGLPKKEYVQKLKYPNGRKICIAGNVVLHDGPNPYEDGQFPYSRMVNYILPREFWGMSEIEQLQGPQKIFNKLVSFSLDVLTLMGNPIWVVDESSGVDTDNLFNRPGLVIEKTPGSEVRREEGVQLQPFVLQLIDRMKDWFSQIAGNQEVSQGVQPGGITAASAIQSLQQAAQTRLRLKSRNIDAFLQCSGQQYVSRVFQFCTAPEIYRLTNNESVSQYFKFHVENVEDPETGETSKIARVVPYQESMDGQLLPGEEKRYQVKGKFDVRVTTGSTLPFAKEEKVNTAKMLFELGIIDEEEVLKSIDYPNWQAVLERKQAKMEAQAQAQQQGAGPNGPGPQAPQVA